MTKTSVGVVGYTGRMGEMVQAEILASQKFQNGLGYAKDGEVESSLFDVFQQNAVVIDFSNASLINELLAVALQNPKPLVICTTGWSVESVEDKLKALATKVPIVLASNTSIGACVQRYVVSKVAQVLGEEFDVDIHEKHHHFKVDSPSGTAVTLFEDIEKSKKEAFGIDYTMYAVGNQVREAHKVGMSVARSGGIIGMHDVSFTSSDEMLEIRHMAFDRSLFAKGALKAASFAEDSKIMPGIYSMFDVLGLK